MAKHDGEAFYFPDQYDPVPGLLEEIHHLRSEGRDKSALDAVLRTLRRKGKSAYAFQCALALCAASAGDSGLAEPITPDQLASPYLAPIATECAQCSRFWFSGTALIDADADFAVTNPIGLQCQSCRYTLCRDCLMPAGHQICTEPIILGRQICPEPDCRGFLGVPVLSTGRPRGKPANPHTEKLEYVRILWQGETVTADEIVVLLDLVCTWQDTDGIRINTAEVPLGRLDSALGQAAVCVDEGKGLASPGALERMRTVMVESPTFGPRLLCVVAAPPGQPATPPSEHFALPRRQEIAAVNPRTPRVGLFRRWLRRS